MAYFNEKARKHAAIPQAERFPRGDAAIRKCHTDTSSFVQLAKDGFGLLTKKKKKFYDFYVRCHIKQKNRQTSRKAAAQSYRACNMAASCTFSTIPHMGITSRGGRFPKYKTQSVVPAIWPVRRSFCFVRAWLYFGSNS